MGQPPQDLVLDADTHPDPAIRLLLGRIEARAHLNVEEDGPANWGTEVIVTLPGSRQVSRRVDNLVGHGGDNAMTLSELWKKFSACAGRSPPHRQIAPLFERLGALKTDANITDLVTLLHDEAG